MGWLPALPGRSGGWRRWGFPLALRFRLRRRRGFLRLLDLRTGQHLPGIGVVAPDETGPLRIAFNADASPGFHRLKLVDHFGAELLVECGFERRESPAQGKQ